MRQVKVYQYRVRDPATGRKYTTRYKLSETEAEKRYPERERINSSEETRTVYDPEDAPISSHQVVFGNKPKG